MKKVHVPIQNSSYDVLIERGLLKKVDKYIDINKKLVLITDDNIPKEYVNILKQKLNVIFTITLNAGESLKSVVEVEKVIHILLKNNIPRSITLVALGGGVIGDLTGFIASIYMRGVPFIQIPTSLLAQVDSSVGGKVGINTPYMKNAIGSFHQPEIVLIDPDTLKTLENRHFNNGMAELIKHAVIMDKELFKDISNYNDFDDITNLIHKSITIKRDIVIQDVKDKTIRQLLNYGHTLGHALEQHSNYELLHGEAISIGMMVMAKNKPFEKELENILNKHNLPTQYDYNKKELLEYVLKDKKVESDDLNIILVDELGNGFIKTINKHKYIEYM